jgi:hypothetical protein
MRRRSAHPAGYAAILLLLLSGPGQGLAECVSNNAPFEDDIRWADIIFAGTLDRSDVVRVHGSIVTRYHFSHVRYVKGTGPKADFVLSQVGGSLGSEETISEDGLTFLVGRRYVAYAHKGDGPDLAGYYALYACGVNLFGIWAETPSDSPAVHVGNGQPLLALGDRYLLLLRPQTWEAAHPASAYQVFEPPPKRSIEEELRTADSTYAADKTRQDPPGGVRFFGLWPHQDPGTRVAEGPFLDWLARVCERVAATDKARSK